VLRPADSGALTPQPVAWLLPARELPVSVPVADVLRNSLLQRWLTELGYCTLVIRRQRRTGGFRAALATMLATPRLVYLARRRRPALVLTNISLYAPALRLIKLVLGDRVLTVADVIGLLSLELEQATSNPVLRALHRPVWLRLEQLWFSSADLVLTVNDRHRELVTNRCPEVRRKTATLRHTTDPAILDVAAADRATLGIPDRALAVGFSGSLIYSRLEPVFAAWEELADAAPCLVVVGDGPDLERYTARARERGWLGRSVLFLGPLPHDRALAVLRACDVGYSECWTEAGFPTKVYEYMALGLPVVVEGKEQMREVLTEGRDALFFRTPHELADALRRLAAYPGLRAELGSRAREAYLAAHTAEHRLHELAELLASHRPAQAPAPVPAPRPPRPAAPRLVSVVVPTLDAASTLSQQLDALAAQDYSEPWEVVIADNGSTDGTLELARRWASSRPNARVVEAGGDKSPAAARNRAVREAAGDLLAFCDADDAVSPGWLSALADAARHADLVGGRIDDAALNEPGRRAWHHTASPFRLLTGFGFLPFASASNCGVWTDVFERLGGFRESLRSGEDIDLSFQAQLAGLRLGFASTAVVQRRHRTRLSALARQQYQYGLAAPRLFRCFAREGMPRSSVGLALAAWAGLAVSLPALAVSPALRGRWVRVLGERTGRLAGSVRNRVLYL
jgi:glycosyltransferase involved in cell wall biosynthesis/GT2 family glycosyltransferase